MRRTLAALAVAASALLSASCTSNSPGGLSDAAAKVLRPAVEDVRQAADTGTYADLRQAVQHLKDLVRQEEQNGDVSSQRATAIQDAADVLLQDARPTPSPTPSTLSPTPTLTSESPTPTPTSESPTPSATSASPTPSSTHSPTVSVSAVAGSPHAKTSPTASPSSSPSNRSTTTHR